MKTAHVSRFLLGITILYILLVWGGRPLAVAQVNAEINEPVAGDQLSGVVTVMGTATHPDFQRYEIAFLPQFGNVTGWIVFAEGGQPVVDGVLAVWDTTVGQNIGAPVFPDGAYRIRLRVIRNDYNYDEVFVNSVIIDNSGTPTPTPSPTVTATPGAFEIEETVAPGGVPGALPSLTPFPSPTPIATPQLPAVAGGSAGAETSEPSQGLLGQLTSIDYGRIGGAFWWGVRAVLLFFALMASYLLLRAVWRFLWSQILTRLRS